MFTGAHDSGETSDRLRLELRLCRRLFALGLPNLLRSWHEGGAARDRELRNRDVASARCWLGS